MGPKERFRGTRRQRQTQQASIDSIHQRNHRLRLGGSVATALVAAATIGVILVQNHPGEPSSVSPQTVVTGTPSPGRSESQIAVQPFRGRHYDNWERYPDGILPRDVVAAVASDLIIAKDYPGFPEAGQLLVKAYTAPQLFTDINPRLTRSLRVGFSNLIERGSLALFQFKTNTGLESTKVAITVKTTESVYEGLWPTPLGNEVDVFLDGSIAFSPNAAKIFLIAKEISHLAYIEDLKKLMFEEFAAKYSLQSASPLSPEDLLFTNSMTSDERNVLSEGYIFRNNTILLDWAGYWHVTPALGKMLFQGILNDKDKSVLQGNIDAFNLAKERGLLLEQSPGNYVWKEGVGPFSEAWQDIMKNTKNVPRLRQAA